MGTQEIWANAYGLEDKYLVSSYGVVKSIVTGKILKATSDVNYPAISYVINGKHCTKRVHRLIALTFIPNPNNYKEINHIDGNKKNNRIENLEWCDRSRNCSHMYLIGRAKPVKSWLGRINEPDRSTPINQLSLSGQLIQAWPSISEIKRQLGFNKTNICYCVKGKYRQAYGFIWKRA